MPRPPIQLTEIADWLSTQLQADLPAKLIAAGLHAINAWYVGDPTITPDLEPNMPILTVSYGIPEGGVSVKPASIGGGQQYHYRYRIIVATGVTFSASEILAASGYLRAVKQCLDNYPAHIDAAIQFKNGLPQDGGVGFIVDAMAGFTFTGATWTWGCDSAIS